MARDIRAERKDIDGAVAGQTVTSLFTDTIANHGEVEALKWKTGDSWESNTWREYGQRVAGTAKGLLGLGVKRGEFVNILSGNRPEYNICDLGILQAGGVPVSLYNTLAPEQLGYIINHCEARFAIVENSSYYERLLKVRSEVSSLERVVMLEGAEEFGDDDWVMSFQELCEATPAQDDELESRKAAIRPDDLATLIYTSGTTGPPKGVMVSHYNVCWTAESTKRMLPEAAATRHISYLPMAHIAERMAGHYLGIKLGWTCHFCPAVAEIGAYLKEVRPNFFLAVPRVWEKMFSGLNAAIETNPDPQRKELSKQAIEAALKKVRLEQSGERVPGELQDQMPMVETVTGHIRGLVGLDEITVASSGAAPIASEILEWFHAIGVPICEVYGQSEDTGPTSWNRPGHARIGTVGPSIPGAEVKLLEDGELLVRGGNVTKGYYKEPGQTAETFDSDGWLHSGDVAEISDDGFIKIVDRKKEIIITAGGKNIAPSNVENLLKQSSLIGQACVIGDRRPYVTALVVLDSETVKPWAEARGLPSDLAELAGHPDVRTEIQTYIDEMNSHLHNQEQVKKFTVLPNEWTVDTEELTPSLKMKRKVVNTKYEAEIEQMYAPA